MAIHRVTGFVWLAIVVSARTTTWARGWAAGKGVPTERDVSAQDDVIHVGKQDLGMTHRRHLLSTDSVAEENTTSNTVITDNVSVTARPNVTHASNEVTPTWLVIFDNIQNSITAIGLLLNTLTVITLTKNGATFPRIINFLLRHQSIADGMICIMAILIIAVPPMAKTGFEVLDVFLCHFWHSQGCYWAAIFISIANLIMISIERFLAICYPFVHKQASLRHIKIALIAIYIFSFTLQICPVYLNFHYGEGTCQQTPPFAHDEMAIVMSTYTIYVFGIYYAFPCAIFIILYGVIIYTLNKRNKQSSLGQSDVVAKASQQLTKTAIVVTAFFFFSIGYDLWFYALGHWGVVPYINNSPEQKAGVFMAVLNSCANPIIYVAFMPAYRKSIRQTLCCGEDKKAAAASGPVSVSMATSMSSVRQETNAAAP